MLSKFPNRIGHVNYFGWFLFFECRDSWCVKHTFVMFPKLLKHFCELVNVICFFCWIFEIFLWITKYFRQKIKKKLLLQIILYWSFQIFTIILKTEYLTFGTLFLIIKSKFERHFNIEFWFESQLYEVFHMQYSFSKKFVNGITVSVD